MTRIAIVILTLLVALTSAAQVVQPSYIRPSKGAAVSVFTNQSLAAPVTSAVYDWSAFSSVQVLLTVSAPPDTCAQVPSVSVLGAVTAGGTYSTTLMQDTNANFIVPTTTNIRTSAYFVNNAAPFIKVAMNGFPGLGATACTASVTIVPQPLNSNVVIGPTQRNDKLNGLTFPVLIGGVDSTNIARIATFTTSGALKVVDGTGAQTSTNSATTLVTNAATLVSAASTSVCSVTVVNRNTTACYCSTTNAVSSANGIPLNPATGANLAGGTYTFSAYGGNVYCITAAGTTDVTAQAIFCP